MITQQRLRLGGRGFSCWANLEPGTPCSEDLPIVVALHGGTYTSRYFDIPGYSLLNRADVLGIPVIALDRPGYGKTELVDASETTHAGNAAILDVALADLWSQYGQRRAGIVLIGHSIGGGIALRIAARRPSWPLLGIAVSGIGLKNAEDRSGTRTKRPETAFLELPPGVKDRQMFGPAGTFLPEAVDASRVADAPVPRQELIDISSTWPRECASVLAGVGVPVHYRQGAYDTLWQVSPEEVQAFAEACVAAPYVDARIVENAGHCIDFHRAGVGFQLEQLAFALGCGFAVNFTAPKETMHAHMGDAVQKN